MKKIEVRNLIKKLFAFLITLILLASIAIFLGFKSPIAANAATDANVERSGLGLSVNAVTTDYLDLTELKDGSPIFDTDWLTSQVNSANYVSVNSTYSSSYKASEFSSIAQSYLSKFKFNTSVSLGVDLLLAAVSFGFEVEDLMTYGFKFSQFYYLFNNQIERYTLSLPNYSSDLSAYKEHLNTNYLSALQKVFSGKMSYNELFDIYGTHVILKGIYGGTMNMFYRVASNKYDVGGYSSVAIGNDIHESISEIVDFNNNIGFNITSTLDCDYQDVVEKTFFTAHGGRPFTGTSISDFSNSFRSWADSVVDNPVLISATSDGLVPLWKLLPSKYSIYQSAFENAFKKYAADYNNEIFDNHFHISLDNEDEFSFYYDRTEEYTITDQNLMQQRYDFFDMDAYPIGCDIIRSAGLKKVVVSLKLEMREQNMGYQHFYLYDSMSTGATPIDEIKYEYGGNALKKDYSYVKITFKQIDLSRIIRYDAVSCRFAPIVIRYGASGAGADDWYNRNCSLEVKFLR